MGRSSPYCGAGKRASVSVGESVISLRRRRGPPSHTRNGASRDAGGASARLAGDGAKASRSRRATGPGSVQAGVASRPGQDAPRRCRWQPWRACPWPSWWWCSVARGGQRACEDMPADTTRRSCRPHPTVHGRTLLMRTAATFSLTPAKEEVMAAMAVECLGEGNEDEVEEGRQRIGSPDSRHPQRSLNANTHSVSC